MLQSDKTQAARCIQSFFLKSHYQYTLGDFENNLRALRAANPRDIRNSQYDSIFKRCLRFCNLQDKRFFFHKLAYTLFSRVNYLFKTQNEYLNILAWLLYDNESKNNTIARVMKDTYEAWKANPGFDLTNSFDQQELNNALGHINSEIPEKGQLSKSDLAKIFGEKEKMQMPENPFALSFDSTCTSRYYLADIEDILRRYCPPNSAIIQKVVLFRAKLEDLKDNEYFSAHEIKAFINSLMSDIVILSDTLCIVPIKTCYFGEGRHERSKILNLSHGGGLFFLSEFFLGKNKGYPVPTEEGGLGVYFDPTNGETNYGDGYYATRHAVWHFDIPVAMRCHSQLEHVDGTKRNPNEVILRHTNRKRIHINHITPLRLTKIHGLRDLHPSALELYSSKNDKMLKIEICQTALRLYSIETGNDVTKWRQQMLKEITSDLESNKEILLDPKIM